jgi:hypothetical protein
MAAAKKSENGITKPKQNLKQAELGIKILNYSFFFCIIISGIIIAWFVFHTALWLTGHEQSSFGDLEYKLTFPTFSTSLQIIQFRG